MESVLGVSIRRVTRCRSQGADSKLFPSETIQLRLSFPFFPPCLSAVSGPFSSYINPSTTNTSSMIEDRVGDRCQRRHREWRHRVQRQHGVPNARLAGGPSTTTGFEGLTQIPIDSPSFPTCSATPERPASKIPNRIQIQSSPDAQQTSQNYLRGRITAVRRHELLWQYRIQRRRYKRIDPLSIDPHSMF